MESNPAHGATGIPGRDEIIARELTGDLPCARCGYNLRGLSILSACAECGLPVKATILALVDPQADELREISHPRLIQLGLIIWSSCAFLACVAIWLVRGQEFAARFSLGITMPDWLATLALVLLAASGLGSFALVKPHVGIPKSEVMRALVGSACYLPLLAATWWILRQIDPYAIAVYAQIGVENPGRTLLRLAGDVSIIAIALLLRPNALRLAHRSVLVRTGRVDRQPMSALAVAVGIAMIGDVIHLLLPYAAATLKDLLFITGVALIALGSFLLTVGAFSLMLDVWRIRKLIMAPGVGLTDIFDEKKP